MKQDDRPAVDRSGLDRGETAALDIDEGPGRRKRGADALADDGARDGACREREPGQREGQGEEGDEDGEHPPHRSRPSISGARRSTASWIRSIFG